MPDKVLICAKVSPGPRYVVPGSVKDTCSRCGEPVWVATSSLLLLHDNPEVLILCPECIVEVWDSLNAKIEILDPTPTQMAEIIEETLRRQA